MNNISLEDYFGVILVAKCTTKSSTFGAPLPDDPDLFEEMVFMVKASSEEEAAQKVLDQSELPMSYNNVYGEEVTWTLEFVRVLSPVIDSNLTEVTEVCSRYFRDIDKLHSLFYDHSEE